MNDEHELPDDWEARDSHACFFEYVELVRRQWLAGEAYRVAAIVSGGASTLGMIGHQTGPAARSSGRRGLGAVEEGLGAVEAGDDRAVRSRSFPARRPGIA